MKNIILFLLALTIATGARGQQVYSRYTRQKGELRYGTRPNDVFPYGDRGYTLILPEGKSVLGTIVMLDDQKINLQDTTRKQYIHIDREAGAKGFAVLYISTGIPVDLFFSEESLDYVDTTLRQTFTQYHLPLKNIFFLGAMVSGHRAMKYLEFFELGRSKFHAAITGVVLSESAIDWVRQWYECQKQVRDSLTAVKYFEGNFMTYIFRANLKTTPVTNIRAYLRFSPYSYFDTDMQKMKLYKGLAIRAYTYADIRYWFSAQGNGVYDSNFPDMSGLINEQKLAGNKNAELIVFHSDPQGPLRNDLRQQAATWDLVDKPELVSWMASQCR